MPVQYLMLDASYWSGGRWTGEYGRAIMVSSKSCAGDSPSSRRLLDDQYIRYLAETPERCSIVDLASDGGEDER